MTADQARRDGLADALHEAPLSWDFFPDPDAAIEAVIDAVEGYIGRALAEMIERRCSPTISLTTISATVGEAGKSELLPCDACGAAKGEPCRPGCSEDVDCRSIGA